MTEVGRFAPSTTGPAHPGTLLSALLCWLDIRSRGGRFLLRLEDLDPDRAKQQWSDEMLRALEWLGLEWDELERQSQNRHRYAQALDALAGAGLLYPCSCSRQQVRGAGGTSSDGTPRYAGTCRGRSLPSAGWRASREPLRLRCDVPVEVASDEDGTRLELSWAGDPLLRRRDGAFAYHLASVVDDAAQRVSRVVRGRDLASSTPPQCALQDLLGFTRPAYRHHFLLLEARLEGEGGNRRKLAKLHGSVSWSELRAVLTPEAVLAQLAELAGLVSDGSPLSAEGLLAGFSWDRVSPRDQLVAWEPPRLRRLPLPAAADSASAPTSADTR